MALEVVASGSNAVDVRASSCGESNVVSARVDTMVGVVVDVLTGTVAAVGFDVCIWTDVGAKVWVAMSASFDKLLIIGLIALSCWPITACDCPSLQACTPSYHVCSLSVSPVAPHFPYQEPPRAQQLRLSLFLMTPQVRHAVTVVATGM